MSSKYHIVYPRGDRSRLCVVEICNGLEYELSDYSVASRKDFYDHADACQYARGLARSNGLTYEPSHDEPPDYLD